MTPVRAAVAGDVEAIRAIGLAAWPPTYGFAGDDYVAHGLARWWSAEAVERGLATTTTLVAEVDGAVVGMGNVDLRPVVPVIWKLYVLPAHQGRGVGGALLRALVAVVPVDRGRVSIEYVDGNDRAGAVYARHGFAVVRREAAERPGWPGRIWAERPLAVVVRQAVPEEAEQVAEVCREGFEASSAGLLPPEVVRRRAALFYDPDRVRREIRDAGRSPAWQGYVVAVSTAGEVLGAAGGGITGPSIGHVLVLYLRPALRGTGIGTALLDHVTAQQRRRGVREQWVSVTEGNEMGLPFYRARGFVIRDRVPFDPADPGVTASSLRMSREIGEARGT